MFCLWNFLLSELRARHGGKCAAGLFMWLCVQVARCRSGGWERFFCKKSCDTCDAKRPVCPGHAASKVIFFFFSFLFWPKSRDCALRRATWRAGTGGIVSDETSCHLWRWQDPNSKGDCSCPSSAPICSHGGVTYQDPSVEVPPVLTRAHTRVCMCEHPCVHMFLNSVFCTLCMGVRMRGARAGAYGMHADVYKHVCVHTALPPSFGKAAARGLAGVEA